MAERISKATGFSVSIESLRPDIAEMFREQGITQQENPNGKECPAPRSGNASEVTQMEGGADDALYEHRQYDGK